MSVYFSLKREFETEFENVRDIEENYVCTDGCRLLVAHITLVN